MAEYEYVTKREYKKQSSKIWDIIRNVQRELKGNKNKINGKTVKLNPLLIGSSKYRLVTRKKNEHYDFDFYLFITNWKAICPNLKQETLKNIETKIYKLFKNNIEKNNWNIEDKTKVIRIKNAKDKCNFEFALSIIWNNENIELIKKQKGTEHVYINFVDNHEMIVLKRFIEIKKESYWNAFKELYLNKKNQPENETKKSFSLYKETINEIYGKYMKN